MSSAFASILRLTVQQRAIAQAVLDAVAVHAGSRVVQGETARVALHPGRVTVTPGRGGPRPVARAGGAVDIVAVRAGAPGPDLTAVLVEQAGATVAVTHEAQDHIGDGLGEVAHDLVVRLAASCRACLSAAAAYHLPTVLAEHEARAPVVRLAERALLHGVPGEGLSWTWLDEAGGVLLTEAEKSTGWPLWVDTQGHDTGSVLAEEMHLPRQGMAVRVARDRIREDLHRLGLEL